MADIRVDIFLETLKNLRTSSNLNFILYNKKQLFQLQSLEDEITNLRGFLKKTEKKRYEHSELRNLVMRIIGVVSDAENIVEHFMVLVCKANHASNSVCEHHDHLPLALESVKKKIKPLRFKYVSLDLKSVKKEIETLRVEVKQILDQNMYDINATAVKLLQHSSTGTEGGSSSPGGSNPSKAAVEEAVVGFNKEITTLLAKLHDRGDNGPLEIIQIVGAGGSGKTTLAREVYDHPLTRDKFETRAWVVVSQDYDKTTKKDLLIRILKSIFPENNKYCEKRDENILGEQLLKQLKGKKYFIVMDDIWDIEAWKDIQRSFPKESKGSKVLFTSRQTIQSDGIIPHSLGPLSKEYSWGLLKEKVFGKKQCPPELLDIGMKIGEKCKGLPLAIVTIAGILVKQKKTRDVWEEVAKNLSSIIAKDQEAGCMEILELSYNHLSLNLKACFLYIGSHPEDYEIQVQELIWLWVAEGFIQKSEGVNNLEAIAEDYLMELMDRNLVMAAMKGKLGTIKTCRIHDLLHELCLKKVKEDDFLVEMFNNDSLLTSGAANKHRCLFIGDQFFRKFSSKPHARNLRSFSCFSPSKSLEPSLKQNLSFFTENFELLRVLCFIPATSEGEIARGDLVHLRYLALTLYRKDCETYRSFHHLVNLETLNLEAGLRSTVIPLSRDIFKMVKLRHLYCRHALLDYNDNAYDEGKANTLDNLQTLHRLHTCDGGLRLLRRTPNLKKLSIYGPRTRFEDDYCVVPDLKFLQCLETLDVGGRVRNEPNERAQHPRNVLILPSTLKRLTLAATHLEWEQLSVIPQTLPNLEVLKLRTYACRGPDWNTSELEEGFSRLRYLELADLDIKEWNASEDQFPILEVLVIRYCRKLTGIPIEFADLNELREIEVKYSSRSVEESAREIQEERINSKGDDGHLNLIFDGNKY